MDYPATVQKTGAIFFLGNAAIFNLQKILDNMVHTLFFTFRENLFL